MKGIKEHIKQISLKRVIVLFFFLFISLMYFLVKSDGFLRSETEMFDSTGILPEIVASDVYVQEIKCDRDGLKQIRIYFSTFDRKNFSQLEVFLCDSDGNELDRWKIDCNLLKDDAYYTFALNNRLSDCVDKTYFLHFMSNAIEGQGITINYNDGEGHEDGLSLNGQEIGKELCYQLVYKDSFLGIFNKANGFHAIIVVLISCILFLCILYMNDFRIENLFLVIWILLGGMYLFSVTLFNTPDEDRHFYRSVEVSYFHFLSDVNEDSGEGGRELPFENVNIYLLKCDWQSFSDNCKDVNMSENKDFVVFSNTALYSPISYIPQAIGIFIARSFTKNIAVIAYAGRIMNWLLITVLLYIAIRIIPVGKELLSLIVLMPMNIHEAISLAPDGMVVAISILMMAYVLYLRYIKKDELKPWELMFLYIIVCYISLLKVVYLPFGILYLLIPEERFGNVKKKTIHILVMAMLAVLSNVVWLKLCSGFLVIEGTNASIQLGYLIRHLGEFMIVVARTYLYRSSDWATMMIGSDLAELSVQTVGVFILAYLFIIFRRFAKKPGICHGTGNEICVNIVSGIIVVSIVLLITMSLYLQWSPVYSNIVDGIQGRYFIALLMPAYFAINNPKNISGESSDSISIYEIGFVACINICACFALLFSCMSKMS